MDVLKRILERKHKRLLKSSQIIRPLFSRDLFSLPGGNKGETCKLKSSTASSDQHDPWQNYL